MSSDVKVLSVFNFSATIEIKMFKSVPVIKSMLNVASTKLSIESSAVTVLMRKNDDKIIVQINIGINRPGCITSTILLGIKHMLLKKAFLLKFTKPLKTHL
jgi:hypothetical protein